MNTYTSAKKEDYSKQKQHHWPASMLRVVSLNDEKEKVTNIEKLFSSETLSLTYSSSSSSDNDDDESGISSLLKRFDYDDIESVPDDYYLPPTDLSSLLLPPEMSAQWSFDDENTPAEGIGILPLPEDEEEESEEESDDDSDSTVSDFTDDSSILTTSTSRFDDFVDDSDEPYGGCELLFDELNGSLVVPWKFQL